MALGSAVRSTARSHRSTGQWPIPIVMHTVLRLRVRRLFVVAATKRPLRTGSIDLILQLDTIGVILRVALISARPSRMRLLCDIAVSVFTVSALGWLTVSMATRGRLRTGDASNTDDTNDGEGQSDAVDHV